jgi:hypothetical protein
MALNIMGKGCNDHSMPVCDCCCLKNVGKSWGLVGMGLKIVGTCLNVDFFSLQNTQGLTPKKKKGSVVGWREGSSPCGFVVRHLGVEKELVHTVFCKKKEIEREKLVPTVLYREKEKYWMTLDSHRRRTERHFCLCTPQSNIIHYLLNREYTVPE